MAGEVKVDCFTLPGVSIFDLVARECPVTTRYGETCIRFDPHSAELELCPFAYGLAVHEGSWHHGEARSVAEIRGWLATDEQGRHREYTVRCLRKDASGLKVGAR